MRDVLLGIVGAAGVNLLTSLADKEAVHRWRWPLTAVVLLAFVLPVLWKHRSGSANAPARKLLRVAAVDNGEGGMDVLAVTKNGKVITATCTDKNLWSPWRVTLEVGFAWDVAAVIPRRGIVEYYALDRDGSICMRTRDRGPWSTWQVVRILGNAHGRAMRVASNSLASGHRELMVITDSGRLLHAWRTDGRGWSEWHDSGLSGARDVTVCAPQDGLFENFAVDIDGEVWHRWFSEQWTEWERWGRPGSPARAVSAFRKLTEYQELFVVGDAGDLGHRHHQRGYAWSDWLMMDTSAGVIDVARSTTSPNSLRCLVVDSEGCYGSDRMTALEISGWTGVEFRSVEWPVDRRGVEGAWERMLGAEWEPPDTFNGIGSHPTAPNSCIFTAATTFLLVEASFWLRSHRSAP